MRSTCKQAADEGAAASEMRTLLTCFDNMDWDARDCADDTHSCEAEQSSGQHPELQGEVRVAAVTVTRRPMSATRAMWRGPPSGGDSAYCDIKNRFLLPSLLVISLAKPSCAYHSSAFPRVQLQQIASCAIAQSTDWADCWPPAVFADIPEKSTSLRTTLRVYLSATRVSGRKYA